MNVGRTARVYTAADYARPTSLREALDTLAGEDAAVPLAGGTDLMVQVRLGKRHAGLVVDVADLPPLRRLDPGTGASPTVIGAAVTLRELLADPGITERYAALAQAANLLGGRQIQAVATLGGNLCNASPAAETMTPLLVHGADVTVAGPGGERTLPLGRFLLGPGRVDLGPGELLRDIRLPAPQPGNRTAYRRLDLRRSVDIAIVSCAAAIDTAADGTITAACVAVGAAAPTAIVVPDAGAALLGVPTEPALDGAAAGDRRDRIAAAIEDAANRCAEASRPIDDVRAGAVYRRAMVAAVTRTTLRALMTQHKEEAV